MWEITKTNGVIYNIGTESTTFEQAIAEALYFDYISSTNDIASIKRIGVY